jgi:hypothetical protein
MTPRIYDRLGRYIDRILKVVPCDAYLVPRAEAVVPAPGRLVLRHAGQVGSALTARATTSPADPCCARMKDSLLQAQFRPWPISTCAAKRVSFGSMAKRDQGADLCTWHVCCCTHPTMVRTTSLEMPSYRSKTNESTELAGEKSRQIRPVIQKIVKDFEPFSNKLETPLCVWPSAIET